MGPAVQYCSALPKTQYSIPYPKYMDYYTSLMATLAGQCSSGTRRLDINESTGTSQLMKVQDSRPFISMYCQDWWNTFLWEISISIAKNTFLGKISISSSAYKYYQFL